MITMEFDKVWCHAAVVSWQQIQREELLQSAQVRVQMELENITYIRHTYRVSRDSNTACSISNCFIFNCQKLIMTKELVFHSLFLISKQELDVCHCLFDHAIVQFLLLLNSCYSRLESE